MPGSDKQPMCAFLNKVCRLGPKILILEPFELITSLTRQMINDRCENETRLYQQHLHLLMTLRTRKIDLISLKRKFINRVDMNNQILSLFYPNFTAFDLF